MTVVTWELIDCASETESVPPVLTWFKFLASKMVQVTQMFSRLASTIQEQLEQYLVEIQHLPATASRLPSNVMVFWQQQSTTLEPACASSGRLHLCSSVTGFC